MTEARAREMLDIALDVGAKLDAVGADLAWMKGSMGRVDGHLRECFGRLTAMQSALNRIDATLTRIENHPRLPH